METSGGLLPTPTATDAQDGVRASTQQSPTSKHSVTLKVARNHPAYLLSSPTASDATSGSVIGKDDKFYRLPSGRLRKINKNGIDGSIGLAREIALTSSQADFHVNHSVKQEKEKELMMTVSSGRKCLESYENSSPHGSSLKTCVGYLLSAKEWYSNKCVLTWKEKVTKSNRLLFLLAPSTPRIEGTECGLLRSPQASEATHGGPNARDSKGGFDDTNDRAMRKHQLHAVVGRPTGLKLQPAFVEWMMGYPKDFTSLTD